MAEAADEVVLENEPSIDDTIRNTLADINARNAETADTVVVRDSLKDATPQESEALDKAAADTRARDESGKFAKQDKPAAAEQASQPNAIEAPALDAAAPTDIDLNRAPSSWKPAAKAAWAALPEPVRAEIYRREGDFHKGNSAIKDNADFGQSVRSKFEPYKMMMNAEGSTPEQGIDEYLRTAALFRVGTPEQKRGMLYQIDKQFNCGFESEFQRLVAQEVAKVTGQPAPVQQQPQQFHDPRVDQLLQSRQQEDQRRADEENRANTDAVNAFIATKDDKGAPLYPFVDNVEQDMIGRIADIRARNPAMSRPDVLKQAYDAAVWANPETRAVLIGQQTTQANRPVETQQRVEAARRASATNVPKRGALPAIAPVGNLVLGSSESDESIRETYRQLNS